MTSAELAAKIPMSRTALSQLENCHTVPKAATLYALADALHCSPDDLLGRGGNDILPQNGGERHAG